MRNNIRMGNARKRVAVIAALLFGISVLAGLAFALPEKSRFAPTLAARSADVDEARVALNNACAYASGRDFSTEIVGTVKARVFGVPYTQKLYGERTVTGGRVVETVETSSAFVNAAIRKSVGGGAFTVATGKKKKGAFVYGTPVEYTAESYVAAFGKPFTGLVKYELGNSVLSAQKIGDGEYEYELDPSRAALYVKNEVRTTLDVKSYPEYYSISFVLVTDGERPVSVTVREKFKVNKFGGTTCSAEYTEKFEFNDNA